MARVLGLHHVQIFIPPGTEDRARAFYGGLLGLREVPKPPSLAGRGGLWYDVGDGQLHVSARPAGADTSGRHPGLLVDDLAAFRRRLEAAGVPLEEDVPIPGFVRCYCRDPFGNRIELLERREE
ncbi:MAG TPA: VOC family protein [Dehalococcoidia bacterium]